MQTMIEARDLLGVFVRALGVWNCVQGMNDVYYTAIKVAGVTTSSSIPLVQDKLNVGYYFILGVVLIRFADQIVQLVYGHSKPHDVASSPSTDAKPDA